MMTGAPRDCIVQYCSGISPGAPQPTASTCVVPDTVRCESHFESAWLTHLIMNAGAWCRASDVWMPDDPWQRTVLRQRAHEVVRAARRLGLIVESDVRRGYRVVGHGDLPRYLRLERPKCRETAPTDGHKTQRGLRTDRPKGGHK